MSKKKDKDPLDLLKVDHSIRREILTYDNHKFFKDRIWGYYKPSCNSGYVREMYSTGEDIRIVVAPKRIHVAFVTNDNLIVCYRLTIDGFSREDTYSHEQLIDAKMLYDKACFVFTDTNDLEMLGEEITQGLAVEHEHVVHDADGFELLRKRNDETNPFSNMPDIGVWIASDLKKGDIAYINGNFITTMIALKFPAVNIRHIKFNTHGNSHAYGSPLNNKLTEEILHDVRKIDGDSVLRTDDVGLALDLFCRYTAKVRASDRDDSSCYCNDRLYDF